MKKKVLMSASVASMIDQFNMPNIRLLQHMGYEVHVACNFKEGNTCDNRRVEELLEILRQMGVVCHQWDCPRSISSASRCIKAYVQLVQILRQRFVWMHCHSPVGGVLARFAAHQAGIPVIYTAHGFHFYHGAPLKNWLLYYPIEKLLAYWTDVLITVNKEDYTFAKRHLQAGRVCYIPGIGIDLKRFQCQMDMWQKFCRKYRIPENARVILSVGELSRRKNHKAVISALAKVSQKDIYYIICGQGKYKEALIHHAKRYRIAQRVRLIGYEKNVEILYKNAELFVFPSRQEGMPAALMEAMAAGMPCIVSDIRGNRELIDQIDVRFQLKHAKELKLELEMMLEDGQKRTAYGEYNAEKIKQYCLPVVQKRMEWIYKNIAHCERKGRSHEKSSGD